MKRGFILQNRKLKIPSEVVYILAVALLSLAVAMLTAANFGVSMIVAPAYLLSLKVGILTFGQAEYVIQAGLFIIFCIVMRGFRAVYLSSFVTCLIYGAALDLWRCIPFFNPNVTTPGSMSMPIRILLFIFGVLLTSFSVAMFYKTYLYPQVYDFFRQGRQRKVRHKAVALQDLLRFILPRGGGDNVARVFRAVRGHRVGHSRHRADKRHDNRLLLPPV